MKQLIFLKNLLLNENNIFRNRNLHINLSLENQKVDIKERKVDIEARKVDIEARKVDIGIVLEEKGGKISKKTKKHIESLFEIFLYNKIFGRGIIMEVLGIKTSAASKLISNMLKFNIIKKVAGYGKGKYKFNSEKEDI